jgi:Domain of unknown function (DUF4407)
MNYGFSLWLAGYNRYLIKKYGTDPQTGPDDSSLSKLNVIGVSVALACILVPINWAIGSWSWTIGQDQDIRYAVSSLVAFFGLLLVVTIDRSVIFAMDINKDNSKVRGYIILRMLMVLGVGIFTSEQIIPYIMRADLELQAADKREKYMKGATVKNKDRANILGQEALYNGAKVSEVSAQTAFNEASTQLARKQSALNVCRRNSENDKRDCANRLAAVISARKLVTTSSDALKEASQFRKDQEAELGKANTRFVEMNEESNTQSAKTEATRTISIKELSELMKNSVEVQIKVFIILFILMMIETMPLLTKMMVGTTNIGSAIRVDGELRAAQIEKIGVKSRYDAHMYDFINSIYIDAIQADEMRRRTLDEVREEVPPYIKSHLIIRMYEDMVFRLKGTMRAEFADRGNYDSGGDLLEQMFSRLMKKLTGYWRKI